MGSLRVLSRAAALVATVAVVLTMAAPAWGAFDTTPDSTWMTNGTVRAVVRAGDTIYIGGQFTAVRACAPGTSCSGNYAVNNVAAFDATTGAGISSFHPDVTGDAPIVHALAVLGGKLFIGGKFTAVEGQPRTNFAAVDATTGALDASVDAVVGDATKYVKALLSTGTRVYAGGGFSTVDGATRPRLAAFDVNGDLDTRWKPRTGGIVSSLALACDGATIFAGGKFRSAAGTNTALVPRETVARFDVTTGALHPWQIVAGATTTDMHALDLAPTCSRLFVGYGGPNRALAFDLSDDTGERLWTLQGNGDFQTVALYGSLVLFGGHFTSVSGAGQPTTTRTRFVAVDASARIQPWAPSFSGNYFGPWDILTTGSQVWVGGNFTTVSGVSQVGIARFTDK